MSVRKFVREGIERLIGKRLYLRLRIGMQEDNSYLRRTRGVIHIGANDGQERDLYAAFGLNVIWVEPIPEIFESLKQNISKFPEQRAFNCLVMGEDGQKYEFHIANNAGASSSVLDFSKHKEMWPEITYTNTITIQGITLGTLLETENIDIRRYDVLVLDTQGSEHNILVGAGNLLANFKFVKVEVPDFESYKGCCQIGELSEFMLSHGFREFRRLPFMHVSRVGTYFDMIYTKVR